MIAVMIGSSQWQTIISVTIIRRDDLKLMSEKPLSLERNKNTTHHDHLQVNCMNMNDRMNIRIT